MINQILMFIADLFASVMYRKPQRILRQLTFAKTAQQLADTFTPVSKSVVVHGLSRTRSFQTLEKYVRQNFPGFNNVQLSDIELRYAPIPSLVPKDEQFMTVYFVHDRSVYDTGLVIAAFDGEARAILTIRTEVAYGAGEGIHDPELHRPFSENHCGEIEQPTSPRDVVRD